MPPLSMYVQFSRSMRMARVSAERASADRCAQGLGAAVVALPVDDDQRHLRQL